jgi:hypothetical protein
VGSSLNPTLRASSEKAINLHNKINRYSKLSGSKDIIEDIVNE